MSNTIEIGDWTQRVNKVVSSSIHEQLQSIARDVRGAFESSDGTIDEIRNSFEALSRELKERAGDDFMRLGELIFSVSSTLSEVHSEVKAVRSALEQRITAVEQRIEMLEARVAALETPAAGSAAKQKSIPLRMDRKERQRAATRL